MGLGGRLGKISFTRVLPALLLAAGIAVFYAFDGPDHVSFEALHRNRARLIQWIGAHQVAAAAVFIVAYAATTAFSLPIGAVMTLGAGFLFGTAFALAMPQGWRDGLMGLFGASAPGVVGSLVTTLYVVVGATAGATILFVVARTALADVLRARAGPWLKSLEAGFRRDAVSYMLILRLIPVFPFWLVNLAPAFLGVSLASYVVTTFIGILPGTFVFALVGNGLASAFAECDMHPERPCEAPDLHAVLMQPGVILPIVGLTLLAGLPLIYKRMRQRRQDADA